MREACGRVPLSSNPSPNPNPNRTLTLTLTLIRAEGDALTCSGLESGLGPVLNGKGWGWGWARGRGWCWGWGWDWGWDWGWGHERPTDLHVLVALQPEPVRGHEGLPAHGGGERAAGRVDDPPRPAAADHEVHRAVRRGARPLDVQLAHLPRSARQVERARRLSADGQVGELHRNLELPGVRSHHRALPLRHLGAIRPHAVSVDGWRRRRRPVPGGGGRGGGGARGGAVGLVEVEAPRGVDGGGGG